MDTFVFFGLPEIALGKKRPQHQPWISPMSNNQSNQIGQNNLHPKLLLHRQTLPLDRCTDPWQKGTFFRFLGRKIHQLQGWHLTALYRAVLLDDVFFFRNIPHQRQRWIRGTGGKLGQTRSFLGRFWIFLRTWLSQSSLGLASTFRSLLNEVSLVEEKIKAQKVH